VRQHYLNRLDPQAFNTIYSRTLFLSSALLQPS